jgi:DNA primase
VDQNPNFSVTISDDRSVCFCFACGEGGSLKKVAHELWKETADENHHKAYKVVLKSEAGIYIPQAIAPTKAKPQKDESLERILRVSRNKISSVLRKRGITDADVKKWHLGFDELNQRDIFPVYDYKKRLVAITGRRVSDEQPNKYFHYGSNPGRITEVFYGEQFLDPTVDEVILMEGPTDAIKVSRYYPNAFGQCGAEIITDDRLKRLKRWFKTVTLLYDGDAAGSTGMFKIGLILFKHFPLFVAFLPKGLDPFDASSEQIKEALEKRVLWSLIDWGPKGEKAASLSG